MGNFTVWLSHFFSFSFFSFFFFFFLPQEGFLRGWPLEWDGSFHSPVYTRGHFSLRAKWPGYVGRPLLLERCAAPTPGESTGLWTLWGRPPRWACLTSVGTLHLVDREKSGSHIYHKATCQHSCKTVTPAVSFCTASPTCWTQSTETEHYVATWANGMRVVSHL